ncbi:MAG: hypothetical protein J6D28_05490 [Bacilli bacterium]|nr:hypothetical protein [Bacilli bacterium]
MKRTEILKRCLNNLYNVLGQSELNGIYRKSDINEKNFPFIELFELDKQRVYNLSSLETEIIRIYIGIWDGGKVQSNDSISERTTLMYKHVQYYFKQALNKFYSSPIQRIIIDERNKFINDNIKHGDINSKILNTSISFIHMPSDYISLLISNGFKTISDLINISYDDIIKLNKDKKYDYLVTFPRYIVETIHSLGLKFKYEEMFEMLYKDDEIIDNILGNGWYNNKYSDLPVWLRYKSDLISLYQFTKITKKDTELENEIGFSNYNILIGKLNEYLKQKQNEVMSPQKKIENEEILPNVFTGLNELLCDVFSLKEKTKKIEKK